jgi:hypothetical protein
MQIVIPAAVGAETLHAGESGLDLARFCECNGTVDCGGIQPFVGRRRRRR